MCAAMQTTLSTPLLSDGFAHRTPWYVPDRRIRTQAAAGRAAEIAQWATNGRGLDAELDEHALFTALHTCAFRAARCDRDKRVVIAEREEWSGRWRDIRECIVKRNLGLAYSMLSRIRSPDPDQDDRVSEAMYGLVRAVERFNPWKGYRFSTYACNVIVRALMRRSKHESRYRGLFPVQHDTGLEHPSQPPDLRVGLWAERLNRAVEANSAELTDIETRVLAHRFPLRGGRCLTFQKIGHAVGLSKERVRQIQNVALKKLRTILEVDPILQ
jgi:RNA polymerase sigma factor (sigma-70 family)